MATLSSPRVMDDVLKWEVDSGFCRDSGTIKNGMGATSIELTNPVGQPVKSDGAGGYQLAEVGDEANVIGLIIQGPTMEAIADGQRSANEYLVLARGPAMVNEDAISTVDPDGTGTLNLATIMTALAARNILPYQEPDAANISTQTT